MNIPSNYWVSGLYLLICVVVCISLSLIGKGPVKKYAEKHPDSTRTTLLQLLCKTPFVCAIALIFLWLALYNLHLDIEYKTVISNAYHVLILLNVTWFIDDLASILIDKGFRISKDKVDSKHIDVNMVKTIDKIVSVIIWSIALIIALSILGIDIKALVATLGIGGVALALAGQDTAKNLIGGITILGDRTFRIGDRIIAGGYDGFVEDIGLRSTKLRTLSGRLVTIPNGKLTDASIENITLESHRKVVLNLGLTYDTTPEKMSEAIAILKKIPTQVKYLKKDTVAAFTDFNDSSLGITFAYYIVKNRPESLDIFNINNEVNMIILKKFNEAGLNFAFPTQTIYVEK